MPQAYSLVRDTPSVFSELCPCIIASLLIENRAEKDETILTPRSRILLEKLTVLS